MVKQVTWFEKYRPDKLSDYVCDDISRKRYQNLIDTSLPQHLLFGGEAGTGKTTLSEIICKSIDCDYMVINGSEETSVDDIRTKVKSYICTNSFTGSGIKVIIYDEMEYLSKNGQAILRKYMEEFIHRSRFILCCNELNKIIEPLKSRCSVMNLKSPTPKMVRERLIHILKNENIKHTQQTLNEYINIFYCPRNDFRRVINELQNNCIDNQFLELESNGMNVEYDKVKEYYKRMNYDVQYSFRLSDNESQELKLLQTNNKFLFNSE